MCMASACSTSEPVKVAATTIATLPTTTLEPAPQPVAPAGLAEEVVISLTSEALDIDQRISMVNDGRIGTFSPVASCSLVEGGSWFPVEIVISGELFIRLSSTTVAPDGIAAIEGQLSYQDPRNAPVDAAVTIYVNDDATSGTFAGRDDEGRSVTGEFVCRSVVVDDQSSPTGDTELSIRIREPNDMGGQRVRRLGFRTSSTPTCPTSNEGISQRWKVENADHPVGGLVSAVLDFDSGSDRWSGEFQIANEMIVVEDLAVSTMPNGLVFSGLSGDNLNVDGALTC